MAEHYEVEIHRWGSWLRVVPENGSGTFGTLAEARAYYRQVGPAAGLARIIRVTEDGQRKDDVPRYEEDK